MNMQQRKRRAEMTGEQREESNRKQREYRARKKAASQNISTASIVSQVVPTSSPVGAYNILDMHFLHLLIFPPPSNLPTFICEGATFGTAFSTVVQTPTIEYKQKDESGDPIEWLHRNDNYVLGRRGPRTVLSGPSIRTNGTLSMACEEETPFPITGESGEDINHMLFF